MTDTIEIKLDRVLDELAQIRAAQSASQKLLYTKREAAAMLSICTKTIEEMVARRELRARRIGRRVLFSRQQLELAARRDHLIA